MTFQHGKNHLGDRNEYLPTVHGFDEFFGNLYHLNAEEEPENVDYPKNPEFKQRFGPRGVLKTRATDKDDATVDPRFGRVGMQTIEDTGPLTIKRMETADEEFLAATLDAMERSTKAKRPFFIWHNTTRMHIWTHLQKKYQDMVAEKGLYGAGMTELDDQIGVLLKKLEDLAIANNTIVIFTSDNGAETFTWPDGGCTPFRGEKNTNWEGGYRVPCMVRWPGVIKPGTVVNDVVSHEDWAPTLVAAAGDPDVKSKLLKGLQANGKTFKVHLDGYNQMELLSGKGESARREFFYFTDDGDLCGLRVSKWKAVFMEQTHHGFNVWRQPMITLRLPKLFDLRADPFERADHESGAYDRWMIDRAYALVPAQVVVGQFLATFKEFPPRQRAASFGVSQRLMHCTEAPGKRPVASSVRRLGGRSQLGSACRKHDHPATRRFIMSKTSVISGRTIFKMSALAAVAIVFSAWGSQAQVELSKYADSKGYIDVQKLTCAQLANTFQEDADFLGVWYSGWYNGLAKKSAINIPRVKQGIHEVIVHCQANKGKRIIQAIDYVLKQEQQRKKK